MNLVDQLRHDRLNEEDSNRLMGALFTQIAKHAGADPNRVPALFDQTYNQNYLITPDEAPTFIKIWEWLASLPYVPAQGEYVTYTGFNGYGIVAQHDPEMFPDDRELCWRVEWNTGNSLYFRARDLAFLAPSFPYTVENTTITAWTERDRCHVALVNDSDHYLISWWDAAYQTAVDDGFLDPKNLHQTALDQYRLVYPQKNVDVKEIHDHLDESTNTEAV